MNYNAVQIKQKLGEQTILEIAKESGFQMREPRKIDGLGFLVGFFMMAQLGKTGLSDWAQQIGVFTGLFPSKQALQKKLQFRHEEYARNVLCHVLKEAAKGRGRREIELFKHFNGVFVEDSTCLSLPRNLSAFYPGPHSRKHGECATARIQLRMDLQGDSYEGVWVNSYRDNDQSFAHEIVKSIRPGSLAMRDQGYFVLSAFRAISEKGAFFLSRLRFGTNIYDEQTGAQLDLLTLLKQLKKEGKKVLDTDVLLGSKEKLPVRLVAVQAPEAARRARQAKAKKDRNTQAAHSQEYMELLGWTIFVTNVGREVWSFREIIKAYRCRWRIEIVFKCWKSKLNLDGFFSSEKDMALPRATITIYMMLAWLAMSLGWYGVFAQRVYEETGKYLSLLKFADFIKERFWSVILAADIGEFIEELARYHCHGKRKSRAYYLEILYEDNLS